MKVLVRHLESDACEYFGIEADELTDAGNMKTLLAKVRFPEEIRQPSRRHVRSLHSHCL